MPINNGFDEAAVVAAVAKALDDFYSSLIVTANRLDIKVVIRRKNPYLFRAKAMNGASEIVNSILTSYLSSSEETIFGNVFFEPVATAASNGNKALAEGIDLMIEKSDVIYAIAVKSGTSVFNSDSKKRQEQNFTAASKLAQQVRKGFVPLIGYGYGRKRRTSRGLPKLYQELAGQDFWAELTGDKDFYLKLISYMGDLPEKDIAEFDEAYQRASNRLVKEFTNEFCFDDGSINWEKLVEFNSGS